MDKPAAEKLPPVTDSPWFWVCLFSTMGIVLLTVFDTRIGSRQAQMEREYQARQIAGQTVMEPDGTGQLATRGNTRITKRPLLIILSAGVIVAWSVLWWRRARIVFRRQTSKSQASP